MKTKNAILIGAVIFIATGTASNLQWSINKYGLLSSSLSQQVLALSDSDTSKNKDGDNDADDTGINERRYKEKKYNGEKKPITTSITTTTKATVNVIGIIKAEKSQTKTQTETTYLYLNECLGEGDLKNCVSTWDATPMR